ncbi:tetratricopeptide repeat protein [Opisthorchis viverrini]|uniref:Tetratricopeptide repeat protein n=1 Tax=Opisthorchis viverrini TaxID=6198 RepID=A0A1S8X975_OPIVI|nr:tetratricopeptide repeat protein [Opisthorchis viverrini]
MQAIAEKSKSHFRKFNSYARLTRERLKKTALVMEINSSKETSGCQLELPTSRLKEDSEDLELSWLLLAEIYIKIGKTELAQELLKRCLQYNKSCTKAYEFTGYVMEKEQNFHEAARNYELAWNISNRSNPSVGYKLAHARLKIRQLLEAIEVCLQAGTQEIRNEDQYILDTFAPLISVAKLTTTDNFPSTPLDYSPE